MARRHKPVSGSRAFWPKKRAKGMYTAFTTGETPGFAAYKAGMTQVSLLDTRKGSPTHGKEIVIPATVLAAPPLVAAGIKAYRRTPEGLKDAGTLWATGLTKELSRKTSLPSRHTAAELKGDEFRLLVQTKPHGVLGGRKVPDLFELPVKSLEEATARLGKEVAAAEVFKEGEYVDVRAVSTGKGFQGPVKRFGVIIRGRKVKKKMRHIGNLGPRSVARVRANTVAEAGQMGFQLRTEFNKQILRIADGGLTPAGGWVGMRAVKGSYILLKGSVPGPRKRLVMLRKGIRAPAPGKIEIKAIALESQQ